MGSFNRVQEISSFYGDMNGFHFVSLYELEPFGITYIEAARLGCVVILYKSAGAFECLSGTAVRHPEDFFSPVEGGHLYVDVVPRDTREELVSYLQSY
jgi:hypothetical protein